MKMIKRFMLVSLLCSSFVMTKGGVTGSLVVDENFIKEHSVSKELTQKLDQHSEELARLVEKIDATPRQKHGVWTFDWLPGYYVKYNVSRVIKRESLARCIEEEGLDLLHTPEKLLYHIKGRPNELTNLNYVVLSKKVRDTPKEYQKRMDLEQVKQFITAIEKTGHVSTFEPNFLRLAGRRISFIDTDGTFNVTKPNTGFTRLLDRTLSHYYTPDALDYIIDKIAEKLVTEPSQNRRKKCISDIEVFLSRRSPSMKKKVTEAITNRMEYYRSNITEGQS